MLIKVLEIGTERTFVSLWSAPQVQEFCLFYCWNSDVNQNTISAPHERKTTDDDDDDTSSNRSMAVELQNCILRIDTKECEQGITSYRVSISSLRHSQ